MKIAVVLFTMGGPESLSEVRPFLIRLFSDPAILPLPPPLRQGVARLLAKTREKKAQELYAQTKGKSPLPENTRKQASALEAALENFGTTRCFVALRYSPPFLEEVAENIKKFQPDVIVRLPLYPQYSTTTTGSSFRDFDRVTCFSVPVKSIESYPTEDGFLEALAKNIRGAYEEAKKYGKPRLLFSAHGLPERIIKAGDPYALQCQQTAAALIERIKIPTLETALCYQSRLGPLRWLTPTTKEEINRAGRDRVPLIVAPISFVCENVETQVELKIMGRQQAEKAGVPSFSVVPAVSTAPEFIEGLAALVRRTVTEGAKTEEYG